MTNIQWRVIVRSWVTGKTEYERLTKG